MKKYSFTLLLFLLIIFLVNVDVDASLLEKFDKETRDFVQSTNGGSLGSFMSLMSRTGDRDVAFMTLAIMPNGEFRTDVKNALLSSQAITEAVKRVTGKTRPRTGRRDFDPFSGDMSFPSGHASGAVAFATVLSEHYPDYKWYGYTWASLVAISRIYEDAHWASDVIVGSAVGHYSAKWSLNWTWDWTW